MQKTISQMKRTPFQDPQTGEYNLRFNLMNQFEDFFNMISFNLKIIIYSIIASIQAEKKSIWKSIINIKTKIN